MNQPCGCCEGVHAATPATRFNRSGLSALRYRVGTYGSFFAGMQARLSSADYPELAPLTVRTPDDPAIALLDAWACAADVLTFYQERIANEGYLRTATERRSVLELARLVGYRLRPGVAASVHLAYSVDRNAGPTSVPRGARANSIPAPGEQMQVFETSEALPARHDWNLLRPRSARPHTRETIDKLQHLYLKGTATNLKPNDILLVHFGDGARYPSAVRAVTVTPDAQADRTLLTLVPVSVAAPAVARTAAQLKAANDRRAAQYQELETIATALFDDLPKAGAGMGALLGRIKLALEALMEGANNADAAPATLAAKAQTAFQHELARARLRKAPDALLEWLEKGATALAQMHASFIDAPAMPDASLRTMMAAPTASTKPSLQIDTEGFKRFVDALKVPPSLPPASSRKLQRDAKATFAAHADIYPRVLAALLPAVGAQLYAGLGTLGASDGGIRVYALRRSAPMFGHNAQPVPVIGIEGSGSGVVEPALAGAADVADLDAAYERIVPASYALIERSGSAAVVAAITAVEPISVARYGMAGRVTRLKLDQPWLSDADDTTDLSALRAATVHAQAELLELAEEPITEPVAGNDIELDTLVDGLESGRWLIISGERLIGGTEGVMGAELLMLAGVSGSEPRVGATPHTRLRLGVIGSSNGLAYQYKRDTVTIYANVVHATHGETRNEVMGSGDAATPLQRFTLKQPPLTYVSAPTTSGVASTLQVRVNDMLWHEAPGVTDLVPGQRAYVTSTDDEGKTSVTFGDGVFGARLPTAPENVRARYRNGIGKGGNVAAGQISLLADKPLGVSAVVNPIRASGGADREARDLARRNAPLAVTALDRLVSTQDYADFARLFGGVGKAAASRLATPGGQTVVVTIAGVDDSPVDATSDLMRNLGTALRRFGDAFVPVVLRVREALALVIEAKVKVLPDYDWEFVEPAVRAALLDAFGFDKRELGQGVRASAVLATIQRVRGVDYVDLERLAAISADNAVAAFVDPDNNNQLGDVHGKPAAIVDGQVRQAQLVYLQPQVRDTLILNEVTS